MFTPRARRMSVPMFMAVLIAGCAGRLEERDHGLTPAARGGVGVLTSSEIQASGTRNALDAVRRLRPELLTRRADALAAADQYRGAPVVYVNGVLQGGLDMLESIPASAITEIRYLSGTGAADRFGVRHPGGVIAVSTRRQ